MLSSAAVRIDSSYVIDLRHLEMNHIKDFTFVHGELRSSFGMSCNICYWVLSVDCADVIILSNPPSYFDKCGVFRLLLLLLIIISYMII